jgi:hypothetical protein
MNVNDCEYRRHKIRLKIQREYPSIHLKVQRKQCLEITQLISKKTLLLKIVFWKLVA